MGFSMPDFIRQRVLATFNVTGTLAPPTTVC